MNNMDFKQFCELLNKLENTSSRNEMMELLAEGLKLIKKEEVSPTMYFLQGRIAPLFSPIEFNLSTKSIIKALEMYAANSINTVSDLYNELGDIGLVAERLENNKKGERLSIREVYDKLHEIADLGGKDSQADKQKKFQELAKKVSGIELKYISKIIIGKLRLGLSDKTFIDTLSWALVGDKSLKKTIEMAYGVNADLGHIAELALFGTVEDLERVELVLGIPIASKLVQREKSVQTLFERLGKCLIQPKYDGLRLQIHYKKDGFKQKADYADQSSLLERDTSLDKVQFFSRNMENLTSMMPDIARELSKLKVDSLVIDTEAIGYDPETDELLPFQATISRKRKTGIEEAAKEVPLKVFSFDLLYLNGKDLTKEPVQKRLSLLKEVLDEGGSENILMAESPVIDNVDALDAKFKEYTELGLEGLIAKELDTMYKPGTRNYDWIKLKTKSIQELADTVDAVVLGYYYGAGVRAKFGIGALLIGAYDNKEDRYVSLAKLGTGIKDEQWVTIKQHLDRIQINELPKNVEIDKTLVPDVLVIPEVVVVVEADEVTKSQSHGHVGKGGYSLRFPRLKEFNRKDKNADQITTIEELEQMANFGLI